MSPNPATQPNWLELPAGILSEEGVILVRVAGDDNHIAFASTDPNFPPNWNLLEKTALGLQRRHGLDYPEFLRKLKRAAAKRLPRR